MKFNIGDTVEFVSPHPYAGEYGKVRDSATNEQDGEMYIVDLDSMNGDLYGEARHLALRSE